MDEQIFSHYSKSLYMCKKKQGVQNDIFIEARQKYQNKQLALWFLGCKNTYYFIQERLLPPIQISVDP